MTSTNTHAMQMFREIWEGLGPLLRGRQVEVYSRNLLEVTAWCRP
jgi:hypothetical protein